MKGKPFFFLLFLVSLINVFFIDSISQYNHRLQPSRKIEPDKMWTPISTPAIPRGMDVEVEKPKEVLGMEELKSPKVSVCLIS